MQNSSLGHKVDNTIASSKSMAVDLMHDVEDRASEYYDIARKEVKKVGKETEVLIKKNPLLSIALIGGAAYLIGRFYAARRRS